MAALDQAEIGTILPCGEVRHGEVSVCHYPRCMAKNSETAVLYNSQCPVCNVEIGHYARYVDEAGLTIRFDDLNTDARERWGLDSDTAARNLYVQHDGVLVSGVPAFLVLWSQMPRYRLLAKIVGLPGISHVASAAYDHVFAPALYRWHRRRQSRKAVREQGL
ncbi:thiol-disulfide oxidoreductase DCC family protein [Sandarakinorhabdus sp.]|uniref:thiol-disulfide oxidoreductase DCC family protein n=1 Tax=Sandarakinorhabdus sp. TaxID=1916663 RepID=UPI003F72AEEA